jgi:hypothetical protein
MGRLDRQGLALIGVTLHGNDAAGHRIVAIDQRTAPGARHVAVLVERQHLAAAQHDLRNRIALHPLARRPCQGVGVDDALDRLNADAGITCGQLELVGLALLQRLVRQPEDRRPEHRRQLRRVPLVARDLAALHEDLLV